MWAWDNPVPRRDDARGTDYPPAAPAPLVAFCTERGIRRVHLAAPWAADEGPVGTWFSEAVAALADAGVACGPLGGDPAWLDAPELAVTWAVAALRSGRERTDHLQLDVEPWATPAWDADRAGVTARWLHLLTRVRAALPPGIALGVDAPAWLASTPGTPGTSGTSGTLLDDVLAVADRVAVVAFRDRAGGPDGIVAIAEPAVQAAARAGRACEIGVETDTPAVAGGARYTFGDDDPAVLARETALVAAAFAATPGFEGTTVEHHRAWRRLLGLDP
jgi:hypothetical protein